MSLSDPWVADGVGAKSWAQPDFALEERALKQAQEDARQISAERIQQIHDQAFQSGLADGSAKGYHQGMQKGLEQGLAEGRGRIQTQAKLLQGLLDMLVQPLAQVDQQIEDELVRMVILLARQLIRRELNANPGEILAVIREATALLPLNAREVRLRMNPSDALLLRELVNLPIEGPAWQILEDPSITPGGCEVLASESRIDATVEGRVNAAIAALLGDERGAKA